MACAGLGRGSRLTPCTALTALRQAEPVVIIRPLSATITISPMFELSALLRLLYKAQSGLTPRQGKPQVMMHVRCVVVCISLQLGVATLYAGCRPTSVLVSCRRGIRLGKFHVPFVRSRSALAAFVSGETGTVDNGWVYGC